MIWNVARLIGNKFVSYIVKSMAMITNQARDEVEGPMSGGATEPLAISEAGAVPESGAVVAEFSEAANEGEDTEPDADAVGLDAEEPKRVRIKSKIPLPYNVGDMYKVEELLSKGSFGLVYKGHRIPRPGAEEETDLEPLAVKLDRRAMKEGRKLFLKSEYYAYSILREENGFSEVYYLGIIWEKYLVMVMELHGESLDMLIKRYGKFSLKTVIMLAVQLIDKLQIIHSKGIIHRDIKPQNIVIGRKEKDRHSAYIIDFGLASMNEDRERSRNTEPSMKHFCGTIKYASVNAQSGYEHMYRDDMESLGYTFVYLLKGRLPWQAIECRTTQERVQKAKDMKASMSIEKLCEGLPVAFSHYMTYCRRLEAHEIPDYEFLKYLLMHLFKSNDFTWDDKYDWMESKN